MWNTRNSEMDLKGKEGNSGEKSEKKTNHERLLTLGNKGLQKERWVGVTGDGH